MRILILLAHPDPNSFNHAIARTVTETLRLNGHDVIFHDLYEEAFDPLLFAPEIPDDADLPPDITQHCEEVAAADGIVIVHPNWWGQPPAILKGWVDRVIRPGVAYEFLDGDGGEGVPNGLLKAGTALVFNTSNTNAVREADVFGDPLEALWKDCIFDFCGVDTFYRKMFRVIVTSSHKQRVAWLEECREIVEKYFSVKEHVV